MHDEVERLDFRHLQLDLATSNSKLAMEVCILLAVITFLVLGPGAHAFVCPKYIFAFGDSLTDTGNAQAELPIFYLLTKSPYGISYRFPDRPCERTRFCDGRLILDYTAQAFGIPFLEPNSRRFPDSAYSSGVNFAYSAGTAKFSLLPFPTFYLGREVDKYFDFRARFTGVVDVSTALHLIPEVGGNDFTYAFIAGLKPAATNSLSDQVLGATKQSIERLHAGGARFFYIFNQPPAGCTPNYLTSFSDKSPKDAFGCLSAYNAVFQRYNVKLKAAVDAYRQAWPDTVILLFDWYAATYEIIQNQNTYGINVNGFRACCGGGGTYNYNPLVPCGPLATSVCSDPEHYLFWDDIHYTEATYRVIATFALSGQFVDGPAEAVNLKAACKLNFNSFATSIPNPPSLACH